MSTISVRRVTDADLETLVEQEPRPELGLSRLRLTEMQQQRGIFAAAELDGELAGTAFLDFADEHISPAFKNLWVFPGQRRRGVATALWNWLEKQAKQAGLAEVNLSVDPDNSRAIPFFLERGYSPTGNHVELHSPQAHELSDPTREVHVYAVYRKSLLAW